MILFYLRELKERMISVEDIQQAFMSLLIVVVTGSIGLISVYIQKWLSNLTKKLEAEAGIIEDELLRENVTFAIDTIEKIVHDTVYSLQVSVVDDIKKASEDGKLTKEEGIEIFNMAKDKILSQVPTSLQLMAKHSIEDLEEYINLKIEEQLEIVKQELGE